MLRRFATTEVRAEDLCLVLSLLRNDFNAGALRLPHGSVGPSRHDREEATGAVERGVPIGSIKRVLMF